MSVISVSSLNPFKKKTVNDVIKQFNDAIDSLDKIAAQQAAEQVRINDEISKLSDEETLAHAEKNRANRIAARLRDLFRDE
jgi:ribosomal protein S20